MRLARRAHSSCRGQRDQPADRRRTARRRGRDGEGRQQRTRGGRDAVERPQPPPFDVVLMDLQMPEMDGYQATAKLRSDARFATLPIIAMTAHATIEERQRCLAAGMNDHVSKPIDPDNLFETVGRFYKPRRSRPARSPERRSRSAAKPQRLKPRADRTTCRHRRARHEGRPDPRRGKSETVSETAAPVRRATRPGGRADHRRAGPGRRRPRRAPRAHAQRRGRQHRRQAGPGCRGRFGETHSRPGRRRRSGIGEAAGRRRA